LGISPRKGERIRTGERGLRTHNGKLRENRVAGETAMKQMQKKGARRGEGKKES